MSPEQISLDTPMTHESPQFFTNKTPISSQQNYNLTCKRCQTTYDRDLVSKGQLVEGSSRKNWKQLKSFLMRLGNELEKINV